MRSNLGFVGCDVYATKLSTCQLVLDSHQGHENRFGDMGFVISTRQKSGVMSSKKLQQLTFKQGHACVMGASPLTSTRYTLQVHSYHMQNSPDYSEFFLTCKL